MRHLLMGQITTTQNLVAIKEVRHAGQWSHYLISRLILTTTVINFPSAYLDIFCSGRPTRKFIETTLQIYIYIYVKITLIILQKYGEVVICKALNTMHDVYLHLREVFCGIPICFNSGIQGIFYGLRGLSDIFAHWPNQNSASRIQDGMPSK